MTLVLFARILEPRPTKSATTAAAVPSDRDSAPVHDPVTAIVNFAAWPADASR